MIFKKFIKYIALVLFFCFFPLTLLPAANIGNFDALIAGGNSLLKEGKTKEALHLYTMAFKQTPDNPEVNFKLGIANVAVKDYEAAVMAFERVLIINPDLIQAKIEIAKAFYHLGATETAKQYFQEVIDSDVSKSVRENITALMASMP